MSEPIRVEVVSATGLVWEGDALSIIARTTEGDVGIMPGHEPFLATLVACAAEILTADGRREVVLVHDGFISVADNRVSLLSQYARVAQELDLDAAQREFAAAEKRLNEGATDEETMRHYRRAQAQVRAAQMAEQAD